MPSSFLALPHQYGAEVRIRDVRAFDEAYGGQGDGAVGYVIVPPSEKTLAEWARSCLGLESYKGLHRSGGWSPFRSAEVAVQRDNGQVEHLWYKLGEDDHDFLSRTRPTDYPLHSWVDTVQAFARVALREFVRASEDERLISPRGAVMEMRYTEWGSATDTFFELLGRAGIEPAMLFEGVLKRAWDAMLSLPVPAALSFVTLDSEAQDTVITWARSTVERRKGLRV
jgi:hypothetical protein